MFILVVIGIVGVAGSKVVTDKKVLALTAGAGVTYGGVAYYRGWVPFKKDKEDDE
jgi:hypothetical protein